MIPSIRNDRTGAGTLSNADFITIQGFLDKDIGTCNPQGPLRQGGMLQRQTPYGSPPQIEGCNDDQQGNIGAGNRFGPSVAVGMLGIGRATSDG